MIALCKDKDEIKGKIKPGERKKLKADWSFSIVNEAYAIEQADWDKVLSGNNFFLQRNYLQTIEDLNKHYMQFRYVIIYQKNEAVLIAYLQLNDFSADLFGKIIHEQLNTLQIHKKKLFESYIDLNKGKIILRLVTCGNNFISGEHCYTSLLSKEDSFNLLIELMTCIGKQEKLKGRISAMLFKDFYTNLLPFKQLSSKKLTPFCVEPDMQINLPDGVKSIDDYILLFSKKYRNRAKSILRKAIPLEKRYLSLDEIIRYKKELFNLYHQVFQKAKFKLVKAEEDYLPEMKKAFPDEFKVKAYFLNGAPVSFISAFVVNMRVEAHFIGLDYALNKEFELYQNLLYDLIELSILSEVKELNLGRTASEIKSTVGAKAYDMTCFIYPQNAVSKLVLKPFLEFLQPSEWTPRNPFKESV